MRLFAAIPLSAPIRDAIAGMLRDLERHEWPVRWVKADRVHMTLKFFGEVEPAREPEIRAALSGAAHGSGAMPLSLTSVGAFPTLRRARTIWLGLDYPPGLELLADRVERACAARGFPPEGRPFRPHLTLGRVREGSRLSREAIAELGRTSVQGDFLADSLVLYESRTGAGAPEYTVRDRFDLTT